jgi:hypothetical protein
MKAARRTTEIKLSLLHPRRLFFKELKVGFFILFKSQAPADLVGAVLGPLAYLFVYIIVARLA